LKEPHDILVTYVLFSTTYDISCRRMARKT